MRVLIAVDQTLASLACIDCAARHTWPANAQFGLITVTKANPFDRGSLARAQETLLELSDQLLERRPSAPIVGADCLEGHADETILAMASEWHADLIILGSHNKTAVQELVLGSVSQTVLENAPCSIMIARSIKSDAEHAFRKVLVAIDGSPMSEIAVRWLGCHPWAPDTEFTFLCVLPPLPHQGGSGKVASEELENRAVQEDKIILAINDTISRCSPRILQNSCAVNIATGDPSHKIVDCVNSLKIDLVVLGSHGRTGLEKLLLGSVSSSVAGRAPCSVLVVKRLYDVHEFGEGEHTDEFVPHVQPYWSPR